VSSEDRGPLPLWPESRPRLLAARSLVVHEAHGGNRRALLFLAKRPPGEVASAKVSAEGQAMMLEQAVEYALSDEC
jgi:hypothetical protein